MNQETSGALVAPGDFLATLERVALNPEVSVDKMERLLDMQERVQAKRAEAEFNAAMARVQGELPRILKNAANETTRSTYANLEAVNRAITPVYTREGFALSFNNPGGAPDGFYRVTCTVMHRAGHSREYQVDVPADSVGMKGTVNKTPTHAFGSSMSYGRRYLTMLIFNLTTTNEDDDGQAAAVITEAQVADLEALLTEVKADREGFLRYCKVDDLADLPAIKFRAAVAALEAKRARA
jgi:hypothetical protein